MAFTIVGILFGIVCCFFSTFAKANEHSSPLCTSIELTVTLNDEKQQLLELAFILSGKPVQLEHFKNLDLTQAKNVRFMSSSIAPDLHFVDKIVDPCSFSIERREYDFGGHLSKIETIRLKEADFFSRLGYVKNYIDKNGKLPEFPIDLIRIKSN